MAMYGDEDTVMGEVVPTVPNPATSHAHPMPDRRTLNGGVDPFLAPSPLAHSLRVPVPPRPPGQNIRDTSSAADSRPVSPPGIANSAPKPETDPLASAGEEEEEEEDSLVEDNSDWSGEESSGLPLASLPSGLCYDAQMRYHCEVRPTTEVHPEDPRRIYYIYKELCRAGLVDDPDSSRPLAPRPLKRISARNATEAETSLVHTADHYAFIESTKSMFYLPFLCLLNNLILLDMCDEDLIVLEHTRDSLYFNKLTFASSLLSVGGAIETCLAVATGKVKNAIAVIRPPGHHAEHDTPMGFCLFNNVSVAARVCQQKLGPMCRKILVLDW